MGSLGLLRLSLQKQTLVFLGEALFLHFSNKIGKCLPSIEDELGFLLRSQNGLSLKEISNPIFFPRSYDVDNDANMLHSPEKKKICLNESFMILFFVTPGGRCEGKIPLFS